MVLCYHQNDHKQPTTDQQSYSCYSNHVRNCVQRCASLVYRCINQSMVLTEVLDDPHQFCNYGEANDNGG
jgi:hypothetical protein